MRASHFKVVGGLWPDKGLRLSYRPFLTGSPISFDLDLDRGRIVLRKAASRSPCGRLKTCAAIAAAIRDGYIPLERIPV
jgi:hypothetical protein